MSGPRAIVVLDTNVLIHDPRAVSAFANADVYLPLVVLDELDAAKTGVHDIAQSAREASQALMELMEDSTPALDAQRTVQLHLMPDDDHESVPPLARGRDADGALLRAAVVLSRRHPDRKLTVYSKDVNLRIKARGLELDARDYVEARPLDESEFVASGMTALGPEDLSSPVTPGPGELALTLARPLGLVPNEYVVLNGSQDDPIKGLVSFVEDRTVRLRPARDFLASGPAVFGVHARNEAQNGALNLLLDPAVDVVTLMGQAGTGKTLLALAAGLDQTLEHRRFREIIVTRLTVPMGDDIGFLPGSEEEKMHPWMGALDDTLEILLPRNAAASEFSRAATADLVGQRVKIKSLNFMRGRTFNERYLIIDEAQNLSPHQLKTLVTRAGEGSKVVCIGNLAQIDTPYLTAQSSGLTHVARRLRGWAHAGHLTLNRVERSRLADYASEVL